MRHQKPNRKFQMNVNSNQTMDQSMGGQAPPFDDIARLNSYDGISVGPATNRRSKYLESVTLSIYRQMIFRNEKKIKILI